MVTIYVNTISNNNIHSSHSSCVYIYLLTNLRIYQKLICLMPWSTIIFYLYLSIYLSISSCYGPKEFSKKYGRSFDVEVDVMDDGRLEALSCISQFIDGVHAAEHDISEVSGNIICYM